MKQLNISIMNVILFKKIKRLIFPDTSYISIGGIMVDNLHFYISGDFNPYTNLATEKYLFDSVGENCCILYLWQNRNTVVIGKNQNPWEECRCELLESEGGHLARRLSGGGAVYHDLGNLNFTFLSATNNYDLARNLQIIKNACALSGIKAEISGRNDITACEKKFSGNAFYNSKNRSYHHGTLLISADKDKMTRYLTPPKSKLQAKGVKSVRSRVINLCELSPTLTCEQMKTNMVTAFENVYGMHSTLIERIDTSEISDLARKYSSWDYLYGSTIPFTVSFEQRLSFGNLQIFMQITDGIIKKVQVFTDSMDWQLAQTLKSAVENCRCEKNSLEKALFSAFPDQTAKEIYTLFKNSIL